MQTSGMANVGVYDSKDLAEIRSAVEAVCAELGIDRADQVNRERVASRVMRSWSLGRRTPLGLVQAGLEDAG
ncbi:hypothetical protein [Chelativorans sp. M5D2P16]|uniref:hypothetical protein n=1 Tax=Chelativorans sp. M5D2P16 TaxID=3095678 RepID=UPI002ACA0A02|nr:hypothetical protein [Chelativorans sp. M5D2P16]MDZ5698030.1 hypothetical protein [Chelativorans sp. M5D2P16]